MSFKDCLAKAAAEGLITAKKLEEALKKVGDYEDIMRKSGLSAADAADGAARMAQDEYVHQATEKKRMLVLAVKAKTKNEAAITAAGARPVNGLIESLVQTEQKAALIKQRWAGVADKFFMEYAKGNFLGKFFKQEGARDEFGRAMMGEKADAEHTEFAAQVKKVNDEILRRSNDAGATIKVRKDYGLTTVHDAVAFGKAGFEKFYADVTAPGSPMRWALDKMYDINGVKISTYDEAALRTAVQGIFDGVKGDDWQAANRGGAALAESISKHRFVSFDSYDTWKAYNREYGKSGGDPVNAIEAHWNRSARDISMLEQFGPNPNTTINHLKNFASQKAAEIMSADRGPQTGRSAVEQAKGDMVKFDAIHEGIMGSGSPSMAWYTAAYATARNFVYAAKIIPQAFLSQATVDPIFRIPNLKLQYNLPANTVLRNWVQYLPSLTSAEQRQLSLRLGVAGEDILNSLHNGNIMRDHPIYAKTMTMNDFMGRAFAVNAHMHVLPQIMGRDMLANFAQWKGLKFDDLPVIESLKREGITAADWDDFRSTPTLTHKGIQYMAPNDMLDRTDLAPERAHEVGEKFGLYVNGIARETIPSFNPKTRYALYGNFDPNTLAGMIVRDATMATYFTASTFAMIAKGFMLRQGVASKVAYAAATTTTLLGANAMRMQAKAIAAGRDPYNMNPLSKDGREFWLENAATSGFAGPTLDLLNKNNLGGVTSLATDVGKTLVNEGKFQFGMQPRDPNTQGKLFDIARHMLPGADGWYTKLLVQHMVLDQLQREVDPQAYSKWQRNGQYYQHNFGQKSWWKAGEATPGRAPDLGAAFQNN